MKTGRLSAGAHISLAGVALAALLGAVVGISGYTFHYARGTSYMSDSPEACINCHIMNDQYDGWSHAPHRRVATCNDCHVPHDLAGKMISKAVHGWNHSTAFTFQNFHEPIRIKPEDLVIVENNCVRCHQTTVHDMAITSRPSDDGRDHDVSCVRCHQGVAHGYRK